MHSLRIIPQPPYLSPDLCKNNRQFTHGYPRTDQNLTSRRSGKDYLHSGSYNKKLSGQGVGSSVDILPCLSWRRQTHLFPNKPPMIQRIKQRTSEDVMGKCTRLDILRNLQQMGV